MTTSKLKIVFSVLMAELCSAYAATVRTATEGFVTNRIAAAIAAIPAPDYTTNNVALTNTIAQVAPEAGDYENISNRVMRSISMPGDDGHHPSIYGPIFKGRANLADGALALTKSNQIAYPGSLELQQRWYEDAYGAVSGVMWPSFLDAGSAWHWVASEDYVDAATAGKLDANGSDYAFRNATPGLTIDSGLGSSERTYVFSRLGYEGDPNTVARLSDIPESVTPGTVTNIVRECSLGGIWDAELEVWWTPVMVGGSLTYQATTNVNLNAEN